MGKAHNSHEAPEAGAPDAKHGSAVASTAYKVGGNIYKGGMKGISGTKRVVDDFKQFIKRGNVLVIAFGVFI